MNGNDENIAIQEADFQPAAIGPGVPQRGLLQVVWERRWIVIAAIFVCLAAGFTYLAKATPIFTSTSRLYVEQRGPRIITESQGVMTQSKNYLNTQAEMLKFSPILAAALEQPGIKQLKSLQNFDNPLGLLKKELKVTVGKKDDIIDVSYESAYPEEAAQIVNAIVDAYVSSNAGRKRSEAAEVLKIIQKEKTKRDFELSSGFQALLKFKRDNLVLSLESERGNIFLQRLEKLSDELTSAQLETINSRALYQTTKAMMDDPAKIKQLFAAQYAGGRYASASGEDAQFRQRLFQAREHLLELLQECTEDHPAVVAGKLRVSQLAAEAVEQDKIFAAASLAVAQQRYIMAQERHKQLQSSYDQQEELAQGANVLASEYAMLQSSLRRTENLCDILDDRIKEINVTEDTGALNISILEVAKPGDKPTKPQKARIMAMALVLGLMLGGGLALGRDWMDQRLRSVEEISATVGGAVLGVVPHMIKKHSTVPQRGQQVQLEPRSAAAEAYRTIRTAVYFGVPNGQAKTLLVTSPAPGDGKTTMASNLAIAMAQAGQRTLVLDGDFRNPTQHKIFEIEPDGGLSNILAGRGQLSEFIQRTKIEGLDVLPCGPIPPNPSEMLNSQVFVKVLEELSGRYDHVLIDSPPVMPVTDARILGAMADVTLLVLRAEKSTRKAAEQSREGLLSVGAHILGAVVNNVPRRGRGGYGYYGYYRSYYPYRYGRKDRQKESPAEATVG